jgi:flavin reductase (DIM6/NTAB) family NADH-FMN oxidoreductase RutF
MLGASLRDRDPLATAGGESQRGAGCCDQWRESASHARGIILPALVAAAGETDDAERFRRALTSLPTAVTVVTALGEDGPSGATANAVASLSLRPPLMLAALDRNSRTLRALERSGRFGINVLASDQAELARGFARKAPTPEKWEGVEWSERNGAPALGGVVLWIACELRDLHDGGDHVIATGRLLDLEAAGGDPLLFHAGTYRPLD